MTQRYSHQRETVCQATLGFSSDFTGEVRTKEQGEVFTHDLSECGAIPCPGFPLIEGKTFSRFFPL